MDIWNLKERIHWKKDQRFHDFVSDLVEKSMDFDQTCRFVGVDKFCFTNFKDRVLDLMKIKWMFYIKKWNNEREINSHDKIMGFAAVIFLYVVLPYEQILGIEKCFTAFEAGNINMAHLYITRKNLPFININKIIDDAKLLIVRDPREFPSSLVRYVTKKYDRATWWIIYMVYEKKHNLKPIVTSPGVKIKVRIDKMFDFMY